MPKYYFVIIRTFLGQILNFNQKYAMIAMMWHDNV